MTREEAIKYLKELPFLSLKSNTDWAVEQDINNQVAVHMAIKALEQVPCEDAISRNDALKALDYDIKSFEFKSGVSKHMNEIANLLNTIYEIQSDNIKALPPVQSKQTECEDAISRQAAIDALDERFDEIPMEQTTEILLLRKDLRTLPPVQPKYNTSEWCKTCSEYNQDKHCCPRYNGVIREAVEEMKQPCEDTISRQDALDALHMCLGTNSYDDVTGDSYICYEEAEYEIEKLPSVQPKTGHWIYENYNWRCSECNEPPKTMGYVGTSDFMTEHFKFCNHCGAKMIEPQESEES